MPKLRIVEGDNIGREFSLSNKPLLVGRRDVNAIAINHAKVSRSHAEIGMKKDGSAYIKDLHSSNGTFLNGIKIPTGKPRDLQPGDEFRIGDATIRYFDEDTTLPDVAIPGHELIDVIAEGGMGTIYLARQVSMDREVAVKILSSRYVNRKEFVERFIQEARAAGKLNHPNIVQVHNVGKAGDNCYYFTMELVRGGNLTQRMGRSDPPTLETIVNVGARIADALQYAHDHKIIHRDIKPDNIVIADTGEVKLADLGIAKSPDMQEPNAKKRVLGTPHYMSPEQAAGKEIDARSDLYSLGATLYHAIAGSPVFEAESSREVMAKHVRDAHEPLGKAAANTPESVCLIVDKLLSKNPAERYQTAAEVRDDLDAASKNLGKVPSRKKQAAADESDSSESGRMAAATGSRRKRSSSTSPAQLGIYAAVLLVVGILAMIVMSGNTGNNTDGNGNNNSNGTGVNVQAQSELTQADALFKAGNYESARQRYTVITSRYVTENDVVNAANDRLRQIRSILNQKRRDTEREEAWQKYTHSRDQAPEDFEAQRTELAKLERDFGAELGEQIAAERERIQKAARSSMEQQFALFSEDVNTLARGSDFDGALGKIEAFARNNPNHPNMGQLPALRDKITAAANKVVADYTERIDKARKEKKFTKVLTTINTFNKRIKFRKASTDFQRIADEVKGEITKAFAPIVVEVRKHILARDFGEAVITLGKNKLLFMNTSFESKIKEMEELTNGMRLLHKHAIDAISSSQPWEVPPEFGFKKLTGKTIVGATRTGISYQIGLGQSSFKWNDLTPDEIYKLYNRYIPGSSASDRKYVAKYKELFVK